LENWLPEEKKETKGQNLWDPQTSLRLHGQLRPHSWNLQGEKVVKANPRYWVIQTSVGIETNGVKKG